MYAFAITDIPSGFEHLRFFKVGPALRGPVRTGNLERAV